MDNGSMEMLEILKLYRQIDALQYLKEAFELGIGEEDEVIKSVGFTPDEVLEIKSVLDTDLLTPSLLNKLDAKKSEINKELNKKLGVFLADSILYIYHDWRKALKARWPGIYRNEPVRSVLKSRVIFLSVLEVRWKDIANRDCVGYFGAGVYSTEFVASHSEKAIDRHVPIDGILITKNLLNEIFASPPRVIGSGGSVHRELISRIVVGELLSNPRLKTQTISLFMSIGLKGKSDSIEFLNAIRSSALLEKKGKELVFLSALPDFYNKLIVSEEKFMELMESDIKGEPGVAGYEGALEKLNDLYNVMDLDMILNKIREGIKKTLRFVWDEFIMLHR